MRTIDLAETFQDRAAVFAIRGAVFVAEQQVPIAEEPDSHDPGADHLLARIDGVPAGTGRLVAAGERGVLGRLAVLPEARGTGTGAALVRAIEERARKLGLGEIELHAQTHALRFYERLGYAARGEEFLDAGIRHLDMRKRLD
ncbi:acetyltransferase [Streptomonospora alba]|uniref:Acetyltransferase n=1 Tax=Streptomonospora alba TaxID=183763 RepID=A0A0C2G5S8_9ACTN|nr:GNAT family N-acetyltransferase [Streptomonospora alba]KIH98633.1 acetyltransferase [Streptomonospora alba]